jgi:hypothetical protein
MDKECAYKKDVLYFPHFVIFVSKWDELFTPLRYLDVLYFVKEGKQISSSLE